MRGLRALVGTRNRPPREAPPESVDVAIVGGGLAGGIVADRLTAAGQSCLMIEAGRHWHSDAFPLPELTQGQLFWNQGMEFTTDGRMMVLRGKGVGGSSVVNQALLDHAPEAATARWGAKTGMSWLEDGTLRCRSEALLKSGRFQHRVIPEEANNRNAKHFLAGMAATGHRARQLRRAQAECGWDEGQNCMDCLGGCPRRSKQSALVTTIPRAEARGLRILAETEVDALSELRDGVTLMLRRAGRRHHLRAAHVVLTAGAIGTTAILLRSGLGGRAVGDGFFVHPQFNTFARFADPVDGHLGAFQSVASDEPAFAEQGFKLECIALPRAVMALTLPWSGTQSAQLDDYRHWAGAEASIRDTDPGRIRAGKHRVTLVKHLSDGDKAKRAAARHALNEVFRAAGAERIVHGWASLSVHPMGGASLGGVVDPEFRPHGTRRIRVADVSLFPDALGANPSLTVMALADLAADAVLADRSVHV